MSEPFVALSGSVQSTQVGIDLGFFISAIPLTVAFWRFLLALLCWGVLFWPVANPWQVRDNAAKLNSAFNMTSSVARIDRPQSIVLHKLSRVLELSYADGTLYRLPYEFLRVYSPSAEVRGHGPGQGTLQTGKRMVDIVSVMQVGNYAIQPTFSDGHNSGIYTWDYLHFLGQNQDALWADYIARLQAAGLDRDTPMPAATGAHACSSR